MNFIKRTLLSGKRRHFALTLGLGYGYLQYKFFDDLLTSRANTFDRSITSMSKILSDVLMEEMVIYVQQ